MLVLWCLSFSLLHLCARLGRYLWLVKPDTRANSLDLWLQSCAGLLLFAVLLQLQSLFGALSPRSLILPLILAFWPPSRPGYYNSFWLRTLFCTSLASFFLCLPISYGDTGIYHHQAIMWLSQKGPVQGLGLLAEQLGYHSSWFGIAAVFNHGPLAQHISSLPAVLFAALLFLAILAGFESHPSQVTRVLAVSALLLLSFLLPRAIMNAPNPDLGVFLGTLCAAIMFLRSPKASRWEPAMMGALIFSVKGSGLFPAILLAGWSLRQQQYASLLRGACLLLPAAIESGIKAGAVFAPLPLFPLNLPHSPTVSELLNSTQTISEFARYSQTPPPQATALDWLWDWPLREPLFACTLLLFPLVRYLSQRYSSSLRLPSTILLNCLAAALLFGFFSAPTWRYAALYCVLPWAIILCQLINNTHIFRVALPTTSFFLLLLFGFRLGSVPQSLLYPLHQNRRNQDALFLEGGRLMDQNQPVQAAVFMHAACNLGEEHEACRDFQILLKRFSPKDYSTFYQKRNTLPQTFLGPQNTTQFFKHLVLPPAVAQSHPNLVAGYGLHLSPEETRQGEVAYCWGAPIPCASALSATEWVRDNGFRKLNVQEDLKNWQDELYRRILLQDRVEWLIPTAKHLCYDSLEDFNCRLELQLRALKKRRPFLTEHKKPAEVDLQAQYQQCVQLLQVHEWEKAYQCANLLGEEEPDWIVSRELHADILQQAPKAALIPILQTAIQSTSQDR